MNKKTKHITIIAIAIFLMVLATLVITQAKEDSSLFENNKEVKVDKSNTFNFTFNFFK